jgi:hypothetical protein
MRVEVVLLFFLESVYGCWVYGFGRKGKLVWVWDGDRMHRELFITLKTEILGLFS